MWDGRAARVPTGLRVGRGPAARAGADPRLDASVGAAEAAAARGDDATAQKTGPKGSSSRPGGWPPKTDGEPGPARPARRGPPLLRTRPPDAAGEAGPQLLPQHPAAVFVGPEGLGGPAEPGQARHLAAVAVLPERLDGQRGREALQRGGVVAAAPRPPRPRPPTRRPAVAPALAAGPRPTRSPGRTRAALRPTWPRPRPTGRRPRAARRRRRRSGTAGSSPAAG